MITDSIGVAVGVNTIFQPFFTRTDDGWRSWQSSSFYIEHNETLYEGRLSDVRFLNASVGFATAIVDVPSGGAIVRTVDGGMSWDTVYFSSEGLYGIDFTSQGTGYAVGNHGVILQTQNNGDSWDILQSGVDVALHAVDFPSETTGAAVGDNGVILRTENMGVSWIQQISGVTNNIFDVQFITKRIGVVIGENGMILRTTTGGYPDESVPPVTNCTLSGTMEGDIFVSNVTVSFSAYDNISGVESTVYRLDYGLWETYMNPFVVSSDGPHILQFYSIDNVGNSEAEQTREFTIQHPPDLQINMTGGVGMTIVIKNLGPSNLTNASWNLSMKGGIILFGRQKSGITSLKIGDEITLQFFVLGIGRPTITFRVASTQHVVQGSIFFIFVRL